MKFLHIIMLLGMMIILSACSSTDHTINESDHLNQAAEEAIEISGEVLKAKISHIVDGDTISILTSSFNLENISDPQTLKELESVMNQERKLNVRFLAIDTPEITNGKSEWFGKEAKDVVDYMLSNDEVWLEIDDHALFDDYGRLLAHVFTPDGESVQLALLKTGLARTAYLYDDYEHILDYQEAESRAQAEKLNIHSAAGYVTDRGFNMNVVDEEMKAQDMTLEDILEILQGEAKRGIFDFIKQLF